jgi:hypothetical protein
VLVPDKFTFELHDFHFLSVQFSDDLWPPMFREGRELFRQGYFFNSRHQSNLLFGFLRKQTGDQKQERVRRKEIVRAGRAIGLGRRDNLDQIIRGHGDGHEWILYLVGDPGGEASASGKTH